MDHNLRIFRQRRFAWHGALSGWLLILWLHPAHAAAQDDASRTEDLLIPMASQSEAWDALPECALDRQTPLPNWARATVFDMPYLTAAMLELDGIYRTSRELDPRLAAKLRLIAARTNRCRYGESYAEADLRRAGADDAEITGTRVDNTDLPLRDRAALAFAQRMTEAAYSVTDEEVALLVREYGEREVVAMVLHLAYANFFNRLVLALDTPLEVDGPLPPNKFRFPALSDLASIPAAERSEIDRSEIQPAFDLQSLFPADDWTSATFNNLQDRMQQQQARPGRVSVPKWENVYDKLPPGMYPKDRSIEIRWSLVVLGHQPELGSAWLRCLRVFGKESHLDRIFAESMFWIVTRSLQCFY